MRSSFIFLFLTCLLSLFFFYPLLFSHFLFYSTFSCFLDSIFSLSPLTLFSLFLSSSLFFYLYTLCPLFPPLFLFSLLFYYIFKILALFPLIGHNHKVWKTLTQVRPLIFHFRKPRLIEMEFSEITYYILEIPSY